MCGRRPARASHTICTRAPADDNSVATLAADDPPILRPRLKVLEDVDLKIDIVRNVIAMVE